MSFELKPQGSTNQNVPSMGSLMTNTSKALIAAMPKVEELVWTNGRSPLPILLQGRVPDDVWASTFDAVYARTAEDLNAQREMIADQMGGLPFIPCCVPCIVVKTCCEMDGLAKKGMIQQQAWLKLVQDVQGALAPYGVQVTLVQETRISSGEHSHAYQVNVGLKFDVAAAVMPMGVIPAVSSVAQVAPIQGEMKRDGGGVADELAKLTDLHKAGAITDAEFAEAKAKALA